MAEAEGFPTLSEDEWKTWQELPPWSGSVRIDKAQPLEDTLKIIPPEGAVMDRAHPELNKLGPGWDIFELPGNDKENDLFIRQKPKPPLVSSTSTGTLRGGPEGDLTGYKPPEEDQVFFERRLGSMSERVPAMREELNNWKERFNYALSVMSGGQPADWLDQVGAREVVGEVGAAGALSVVPGGSRFPITAMRAGATVVPRNVVPFVKPLDIIAKDKIPPEAANVNVDVKKGWDSVPYTNKAGQEETHHFLFDTKGDPVSVVVPVGPIEGVTQKGKGGWGISFLGPYGRQREIPQFVGDHYVLDDLNKAKQFASESVQSGEFASFRQAYGDYFSAQAKRREGFVRDISKPAPEEAVKKPPTLEEVGKIFDKAIEESGKTYVNKEGMIVDKAMEKGIDETWDAMVKASKLEDAKSKFNVIVGEPKIIEKSGDPVIDKMWEDYRKEGTKLSEERAKERRAGFKEVEKEPEKITHAAIKLDDGSILKGYSHFDAMNKNWEKFTKADEAKMEDGFVTSTGRFVNRDEALDILKKSGQETMGWSTKKTGVLSEDIVDLLSKENKETLRDLGELPPSSPLKYSGAATAPMALDNVEVQKFQNFMNTLSNRVSEENWKKFLEAQPLSENIEDRRNEAINTNPYIDAGIEGLRRMMKVRERSRDEIKALIESPGFEKLPSLPEMKESDFR